MTGEGRPTTSTDLIREDITTLRAAIQQLNVEVARVHAGLEHAGVEVDRLRLEAKSAPVVNHRLGELEERVGRVERRQGRMRITILKYGTMATAGGVIGALLREVARLIGLGS